ncbi:hypothetical protein RM530_01195 [Algiphilus sp. W345]|uniref:Uncharacterized protein n=1 Tax=Banduia mediterranea TaxID=3075609 RepID=A0ABU2WDN6_9GAMM|nr:hypothetical protein [Algiphilus sp. W345]MDT0495982.1 hypothetical protein [Algiphilus sp. W345]
MMQSVAGKKILITGAAMGMGRLYAELAIRESAAAVVLGCQRSRADGDR